MITMSQNPTDELVNRLIAASNQSSGDQTPRMSASVPSAAPVQMSAHGKPSTTQMASPSVTTQMPRVNPHDTLTTPIMAAPQSTPKMSASNNVPTEATPGASLLPSVLMPQYHSPTHAYQEPKGTLAGDESERERLLNSGSGVSQIKNKIEGSSFGQNHPTAARILGGVAQGAARIGDTALMAFSPGSDILIPGTEGHHQVLLRQNAQDIGQDYDQETMPLHERYLQDQAADLESQTNLRNHPRTEYTPLQTSRGIENYDPHSGSTTLIIGSDGKPVMPYTKPGPYEHVTIAGPDGKPQFANYQNGKYLDAQGHEIANAQPYEKPEKPDSPEQQYVDEYQKKHPGASIADAEKQYKADTQPPQESPQALLVVPDGKGGYRSVVARGGAAIPAGAMTPSQLGSQDGLTSSTRTMIESAPGVISLIDRVSQLVNQQKNSLGPAASRWSEFMSGKVGAPNPDFTKLRTDVGLLVTKLMRMHVGARGGDQIMKHFQDLIDSSKQDPENLQAALGEIRDYANEVESEGKGKQPSDGGDGGKPPAGAHVRDYTQLGGKK